MNINTLKIHNIESKDVVERSVGEIMRRKMKKNDHSKITETTVDYTPDLRLSPTVCHG